MKFLLTILLFFCFQNGWSRIIPVGKTEQITSVHKGIEIAQPGDTVLVKKGIYKEGSLLLTKPVFLLGEEGAVLDGEDKYEILTISGQGIVVKGLTFLHSGYSSMNDFASIKIVDASFILIENNKIDKAYFAIHVSNATYCVIQDNIISGLTKTEQTSGNGIHLWKCDNILVKGNQVTGHRDGIYFEFVSHSVIEQNNSHHNIRYGLHFMFSNDDSYIENTFTDNGAGVAVMYSKKVVMVNNHFLHNWGPSAYGLLLKEISDSQILLNEFDENTVGILMESTNRIEMRNNSFQNSGYALRIQASCSETQVHHNIFSANTFDIATNGSLMMNRFYKNYWDKYDGYDMNKDGIGDIPYHPVSMYSMVVEQNPNAAILLRSFMVSLLDKAEKAIPSLTPENMMDEEPIMKKSLL
jgi:nitrous oxidase accessory protein